MNIDELFDFNDDFLDVECSQQDQIKQSDVKENLFSLFFNCSAVIAGESIFTKDLNAVLNHQIYTVPKEAELFGFPMQDDLTVNVLMARSNIQKLTSSSIDSISFNTRGSVTKLMLLLRCNYQDINHDQLKLLRIAFGTFDSIQDLPLVYAFSADGNKQNSSTYHLIHGQLEWRWIYLTILYKSECSGEVLHSINSVDSEDSEFRCELVLLIYDLITLAIAKFNKCNSANIILHSPFLCPCVKVMWNLVRKFITELHDSNLNFWSVISNILNDLRHNKHPYENFPTKKILLRSSSVLICNKSFDQFSIWLVCGLAKTFNQETAENSSMQALTLRQSYDLAESLIKSYLSTEPTEENLRVLLMIISEVIFDVWPPRCEIPMTLWEYYQRKINSPFYIVGQNPSFMAVYCVSGAAYLEKIKSEQTTATKHNTSFTSYDSFVFILGKLVMKFTQLDQKIQIQKILSRIYTKFPATKLQTLNEMGIHNILKLFITLSISTDFLDIAKKVSETLLSVSLEKIKHHQQLMKGHVALLILHVDNHINITQYVTKLLTQVNHLADKSSSSVTSVLKIMAEALPVILMKNLEDDTIENGEHLLLDSWIVKYLTNATLAEQERVFEALTKIIQRIRSLQSALGSSNLFTIVQKLFITLLPHCKLIFGKSESICLPNFVANLCLLSAYYPSSKEIPKFEIIFKSFLESNCANIENSIKFLTVILENRKNVKQLDKLVIIQHWIKFSVMINGGNSSIKNLTLNVMKLDEISSLSETASNQPDEFLNSKEPLYTFLTDVGRKYSNANAYIKLQLIEKIHSFFSNFEKWALPILQLQQQSSGSRTQAAITTDESVMRIYTFISIAILHCSEIIYIRSKSQCFFNSAISHFILPSSLMMNQNQPRSIVVSMYKVWPLLIEGISKLDYRQDPHVGKVLHDLIVKWAPLLKISTNSKVVSKPFLNVTNLNNAEMIEVVYEKLAKSYIALQNRKPSPFACMILTIVEEVMHVIEGDEKKLMMVWSGIMIHVIEAAMMTDDNTPSQITCYNLLKRFMQNKNFERSQQMKELVNTNLRNLTQTHLSYYSAFYFRFMTKITKFHSGVVNMLMPFLITQIKKCEQIRGSGVDMKLRGLYDQLQMSLNKNK